MYSVLDISRYVINKSIDNGKPISNLKLQKLLFYVQAYFLVESGSKLFEEPIVSWKYGPVVVEAYDEFKSYGAAAISDPIIEYTEFELSDDSFDFSVITHRFSNDLIEVGVRVAIDVVLQAYANYSAIDIMRKTHNEDPWMSTENGCEIDVDFIKGYFKNNRVRLLGE